MSPFFLLPKGKEKNVAFVFPCFFSNWAPSGIFSTGMLRYRCSQQQRPCICWQPDTRSLSSGDLSLLPANEEVIERRHGSCSFGHSKSETVEWMLECRGGRSALIHFIQMKNTSRINHSRNPIHWNNRTTRDERLLHFKLSLSRHLCQNYPGNISILLRCKYWYLWHLKKTLLWHS